MFATIEGSECLSIDLKIRHNRTTLRDLAVWKDITVIFCECLCVIGTSDSWGDRVRHGIGLRIKNYYL